MGTCYSTVWVMLGLSACAAHTRAKSGVIVLLFSVLLGCVGA